MSSLFEAAVPGADRRPLIIGLTGSIGMGKSTIAEMLREAAVPVFDADAEVHRLQAKGGALVETIEAAFPGCTGENGVDRQKLGPMVLGKPDALKKLEAIVHPAVGRARIDFVRAHKEADMICFDIPLLYETGGEKQMDAVLVVSASAELQRARVLARPNMTPEKFESILKMQLPDSEKRARADYIIENDGSLAHARAQIHDILTDLRINKPNLLAQSQA